jgi:hypothetical protein
LVPIILPPILRLLTPKRERAIDMPQAIPVSQRAARAGIVLAPSISVAAGILNTVQGRLRLSAGGRVLLYIVTLFVGFGLGFLLAALLAASALGPIGEPVGGDRPVVDWPPSSKIPSTRSAQIVPGALDASSARAKAAAAWFAIPGSH